YNGRRYRNSEQLYQAFKFMDNRPDIAEIFRTTTKSCTAAYDFSMAHIAYQHPDWDSLCTAKMEIAIWHKFAQHPDIKEILLDTGDAELVVSATNTSGDKFWGMGKNNQGRNELGKALERVRGSLRLT
ncbi:hypothetical protein R3P38DRAFT_2584305, partial [Favolaschia claudopus]